MAEKLATFDVWGTLLKRRSKPEDVKLFTCTALGLLHGDQLDSQWRDPERLLAARQSIERELLERSGREREAEYLDIRAVLRGLCQSIAFPRFGSQLAIDAVVDELVQVELEQ